MRRSPRGSHLRRKPTTIALAVALCVITVACTRTSPDDTGDAAAGPTETIVVGVSGAFAENQIVAEMYAQVLEQAGYTVERQFDLRSREVSQSALESGQIDLKPEYLSSLLLFLDANAQPSNDSYDVATKARELLASRGISVLTPSAAQDTNTFVANAETAQRFGLTTMTSLAPVANQLTLGAPPECALRFLCLTGLNAVYGILFNDFEPLDAGGPRRSRRSGATTCRSVCCSPPIPASARTDSYPSSTTGICRTPRT